MDIIDFLEEHGIDYRMEGDHHHSRQGWVNVDCPNCGPGTNKFHLGINLTYLYTNCWKCGSANIAQVLARLADVPIHQTFEVVKAHSQYRDAPEKKYRESKEYKELTMPNDLRELDHLGKKYLRERGFSPQKTQSLWGVKSTSRVGELKWRIWIPIFAHGKLVNWTTRSIERKSKRRYISATKGVIPLSFLLYGEDYVRHSVVVTEGPFDAWKIGPGAVCTFGINYSEWQVLRLSKYTNRTICFDNEPSAQKQAKKLARELQDFPGTTTIISLETGKDPGECSKEEIESIREKYLV